MHQVMEITNAELVLAETEDGSMTMTRLHGGVAERITISAAECRRMGLFCVECEVERLRTALEMLLKEYVAERDSFYDGATSIGGTYDAPDDERAVKEMDAIIDDARSVLSVEPTGEK